MTKLTSFQFAFFDELAKLAADRAPIDWDKHHGKAFRWAITPEEARRDAEGRLIRAAQRTYSLVTPQNNAAWTVWKNAPKSYIRKMRKLWPTVSKSLPDYKYNQIVQSMKVGTTP